MPFEPPLEQLYDEGRQQFLGGQYQKALEQFKRIYALDCLFRDVAEIVEDAYSKPEGEWRAKYQARFERRRDTV